MSNLYLMCRQRTVDARARALKAKPHIKRQGERFRCESKGEAGGLHFAVAGWGDSIFEAYMSWQEVIKRAQQ